MVCSVQGTMAEYLTLPTGNLHTVPEELTDQDACFAEPLAAACRIAEQQVCSLAKILFFTPLTDLTIHLLPDFVTHSVRRSFVGACFAEPLAAACRVAEQQVHSWAQHHVFHTLSSHSLVTTWLTCCSVIY